MKHEITRFRHELQRRSLVVRRTEYVTPRMLRLMLAGEALAGFTSLSPDDHVKVSAPGEAGVIERRDYTPRRYDARAGELTIDFALHEGGPATQWALHAKPGDPAEIGGPRGSAVVPNDFDWWLLIGDETALPAIGRRIEELPAKTPVISLVAVADAQEEQRFATQAEHRPIWVHRPPGQADDPAPLLGALETLSLPAGDGFIWIAGESRVARALRNHAVDVIRHPVQWLKASSYWVKGKADANEKLDR